MAQAVWTGDLGFGLVNIPVRLYTATSPKRVRWHQYEAGTGRRIRYRRVAEGPEPDHIGRPTRGDYEDPALSGPKEATGTESLGPDEGRAPEPRHLETVTPHDPIGSETEVAWTDIVRGYEVEPGRVVTVHPDELESVAPERSRMLEVELFVDLNDIDPVHFEKSYFVVPQRGAATERPYWLLYRAMQDAGKVAVGRFVMRTKEYLVAVRPAEHLLMLETLFYADEIRDPMHLWIPPVQEPSERELDLARQFVEGLDGPWEPERHRDEHRERLLDLIHSKSGFAVQGPEPDEGQPPGATVTDLMEALKASVDAAKRARAEQGRETG
jgi:DNA end-binding protein Ku